ncbi:phosphoserine phosphatase SerB [Bordetella bronchiseptica SBL-F6116]|uniref:phosphoserine phosphatase SerB n=1 Tax=Bordetella bronchiseptica TaxID=518 RepID=UPI0004611E5D|nr:phosphoserine phosphatase SerB [Bordetella bronchiseptica]KDD41733.1 phosphoserine phosphatase SerB [Bordetella bronchiseptica MBORD901]KDD98918.1 phosphoserine phosphatase SerB [Bordetella bronchiseptica SBL-F6116]
MTIHHLVIQSPALAAEHAEQLAALAQAQGVTRISTTAARLLDVQQDADTRAQVRHWAETHVVDAAFVPAGLALADCRILAMDMDSTLINIECIDEIAAVAGVGAQVAQITEAAMRGEIKDFSESLRRRVALLAGTPAAALERVYAEKLRLNPGAERLLASVQAAGIQTLLVSGGFTFFTERLRERLGLDHAHANTLEVDADGKLTGRVLGDILDGDAKAAHLAALAQRLSARPEQIIAIGDGANDLKMLARAGFAVAYHAKPIVREQTPYALNVCGLDGVLNWFEK